MISVAVLLNDVHSRLTATEVVRVVTPRTVEEVVEIIRGARSEGVKISVSGGRHSMGGQPFGTGTINIDCRGLDEVIGFDQDRGLLHIGAGACWPVVIAASHDVQPGNEKRWAIRQKQTGADDLTLAGAISANAHGRGLQFGPLGEDIEDLTLVNADAEVVRCSRDENPELFAHVVGGYGLFGIIVSATLRLGPRMKLRRLVDIIDIDDAMNGVYRRIDEGCIYGDFQYAIDPKDESFLRRGVFACYKPIAEEPVSNDAADLTRDSWLALLHLAHTDKREAFRRYAGHYLDTHGRIYWSDMMQLSTYIPSYAEFLAEALPRDAPESLMITELYVPPERLLEFTAGARDVLRTTCVEDIYGTIRAIRADATSALPWARGDRACVIFNLRTPHTAQGIERTRSACRGLIDTASSLGGSFFLTYHSWATIEQVVRCYPEFPSFVAAKLRYDRDELFVSEWWRLYSDCVPTHQNSDQIDLS